MVRRVMMIRVNIRQLGRKRSAVAAVPFELPRTPGTVRELICEIVRACVWEYNARAARGESGIRPMTEERLAEMETIGKLAFGVNYGGKLADGDEAVANALQGFEDGLYRVFCGQTELTALDERILMAEGDEVTFIRLTMLAGSIF